MSQRHKPPTVTTRVPRDLVVAATRRAGELTAELGHHVPVGAVLAAAAHRGIGQVTTADVASPR